MGPNFFATPDALREWFDAHHANATELLVGFHRRGSGMPSVTWPESVDEAICVGWIDGVRRSIDATSYCVRFTPRRAGSNWSTVNLRKVAALGAAGRMRPAGLRVFETRDRTRESVYSYERPAVALSSDLESRFRAHAEAWSFFQAQPVGYRRLCCGWVMGGKQPATRDRRLTRLMEDSAAGVRVQSWSTARTVPPHTQEG